MSHFIAAFNDRIRGVVSGFDRLVFRACLRRLLHPDGMRMYLIQNSILCKHYQDHVKKISQEVKEASLAPFRQAGLPVQHIQDPKADKDAIARAIAAERNIAAGNVCALTSMELTPTFAHQQTSMAVRWRPTLVIYHYQIDPQFGWMHAAHPDLVSVLYTPVHQRPRMAGAADGPAGPTLPCDRTTVFRGSKTSHALNSCWRSKCRPTGRAGWNRSLSG
jgi:hypothetical protein